MNQNLTFLNVTALVLVIFGACASGKGISKRSDDGDPMTAVVENLSKQLNALAAKVNVLETKQSSDDRAVAFTAWHNTNPLSVVSGGVLIMDYALTNVGNGYSTLTGVFTAPVSGLYDFQASIMSYTPTNKKVYANIYVDSILVATGVADSQHGFWDQTTMKAIVHVNAGQHVMVRGTGDYYSAKGEPYTSFSGNLIKADN